MPTIEFNELDKLIKTLSDTQKALPELRKRIMDQCAEKLQQLVRSNVDRSGVRDVRGRVKTWQEQFVGSRGGYAAVRPTDAGTGAYSPGAITNYLEGGHKNRLPTGRSKRYKPEIHTARTPGRFFYQASRREMGKITEAAVEALAEAIAESLEGET